MKRALALAVLAPGCAASISGSDRSLPTFSAPAGTPIARRHFRRRTDGIPVLRLFIHPIRLSINPHPHHQSRGNTL